MVTQSHTHRGLIHTGSDHIDCFQAREGMNSTLFFGIHLCLQTLELCHVITAQTKTLVPVLLYSSLVMKQGEHLSKSKSVAGRKGGVKNVSLFGLLPSSPPTVSLYSLFEFIF